jgi:hypothetical protein
MDQTQNLGQNLNQSLSKSLNQMNEVRENTMKAVLRTVTFAQARTDQVSRMAWDQMIWAGDQMTDLCISWMDALDKGQHVWRRPWRC